MIKLTIKEIFSASLCNKGVIICWVTQSSCSVMLGNDETAVATVLE